MTEHTVFGESNMARSEWQCYVCVSVMMWDAVDNEPWEDILRETAGGDEDTPVSALWSTGKPISALDVYWQGWEGEEVAWSQSPWLRHNVSLALAITLYHCPGYYLKANKYQARMSQQGRGVCLSSQLISVQV